MKIHSNILALCALQASAWSTSAFAPIQPSTASATTTSSALSATAGEVIALTKDMFPVDLPSMMRRIEGESTLVTYDMPADCERVQMMFKTNGRPMKAMAQLWLGPARKTHTLEIDMEYGAETPYMATLKFKKGGQTLKISTTEGQEFPVNVAVSLPSKERSDELAAITQKVWDMGEKVRVQGGEVAGGTGAVRTWKIDNNVDSVQFLMWSGNVNIIKPKSFKVRLEVLQGPNNIKQTYFLQCGGGSQPYHNVIQTPGVGAQIRLFNKKFVEDGLVECTILPFQVKPGMEDVETSELIVPESEGSPDGNQAFVLGERKGNWWE